MRLVDGTEINGHFSLISSLSKAIHKYSLIGEPELGNNAHVSGFVLFKPHLHEPTNSWSRFTILSPIHQISHILTSLLETCRIMALIVSEQTLFGLQLSQVGQLTAPLHHWHSNSSFESLDQTLGHTIATLIVRIQNHLT
jgi:hypothetical protein